MNTKTLLVAIAVALSTAAPTFARPRIDVPIYVGGDADFDACGSTGTVVGLNPRGDGFLSVRSGPGGHFREIDRIYNGQPVWICEDRGPWMAVVYDKRGRDDQCGVSSPWPVKQPYTGPCRYGWVHSRYIGNLTG